MLIDYPPRNHLVAILLTSFLRVLPANAAKYSASKSKKRKGQCFGKPMQVF